MPSTELMCLKNEMRACMQTRDRSRPVVGKERRRDAVHNREDDERWSLVKDPGLDLLVTESVAPTVAYTS